MYMYIYSYLIKMDWTCTIHVNGYIVTCYFLVICCQNVLSMTLPAGYHQAHHGGPQSQTIENIESN